MREQQSSGFVSKVARLNHEELGSAIGLLLGIGAGIYLIFDIPTFIDFGGSTANILARLAAIPVSSAICANVCAGLGKGIDVFSDEETLVSWIYNKYRLRHGIPIEKRMKRFPVLMLRHADSPSDSEDFLWSNHSDGSDSSHGEDKKDDPFGGDYELPALRLADREELDNAMEGGLIPIATKQESSRRVGYQAVK